jgi:hypothetical protein
MPEVVTAFVLAYIYLMLAAPPRSIGPRRVRTWKLP